MELSYLYFLLISFHLVRAFDFKIMFMVPKNAMQEQQLNSQIESLFQHAILRTGWLVEANVKTKFYFYFTINDHSTEYQANASLPYVFYIYFTLDSGSCHDYVNYTHTPIMLSRSKVKRKSLFIIEIDFILKHKFNKTYFICLG